MVQIGVIGNGESMRTAIEYLRTTDGVSFSGAYSADEKDENSFFKNSVELVDTSDALFILASASDPFEIAVQAFRHGKHVFLEQISTLRVDEIEQLLKSRKEANVKCMIGSTELCHPAFLAIRNQPLNPFFIEAERKVEFDKHQSKNIILDLMMKDIALVLNIVKSDIKRISANGHKVMSDQTDVANARLEFSNGCVAVLTVDKNATHGQSRLKFYEENKIASIDLEANTAEISTRSANTGSLEITRLPLEEKDAFRYQLENFRDSITANANPLLKLREGYEKLDIAHKILKKILSSGDE